MRFHLSEMLLGPAAESLQWLQQGPPERGERVLDSGRSIRMHFAAHEPIAFQAAQRLRQHFLRDVADLALQRRVTKRTARKNLDDDRRPLIRDPVEHDAGRAARAQD